MVDEMKTDLKTAEASVKAEVALVREQVQRSSTFAIAKISEPSLN
jgi:hypothetical protein